MKIINIALLFFIAALLCQCTLFTTKEEVIGTYIFNHTDLTKDSLFIYADGTYEKRIYKSSNDSLIYINKNKWTFDAPNITLQEFLPNSHSDFNNPAYVLDKVLITSGMTLVNYKGRLSIEEDEGYDDYYIKCN